jgi:hypothetical protein
MDSLDEGPRLDKLNNLDNLNDYRSVTARFFSSPDATGGWAAISDEAQERGEQAKWLFEQVRLECEANRPPSQNPDASCARELLGPDHHLVENIWSVFRRHVKSFPGWSTYRREATMQERQLYRLKGARKAYFVNVVYQAAPLNNTPLVFRMGERMEALPAYRNSSALEYCNAHDDDSYMHEEGASEPRLFAKSANSAFSPASTRLADSATTGEESEDNLCRRSLFQNAPAAAHSMPTRSFLPVVPTPANFEATASSVCPLPFLYSGISLDILQLVPQPVFPGGFIYGDIVSFVGAEADGPRERAIVIGCVMETNVSEACLVVKTAAMTNHTLAPHNATLVQNMTRWNAPGGGMMPSVVASAHFLDGRSHVPK